MPLIDPALREAAHDDAGEAIVREHLKQLHRDPAFRAACVADLIRLMRDVEARLDLAGTVCHRLGDRDFAEDFRRARYGFVNVRERAERHPDLSAARDATPHDPRD